MSIFLNIYLLKIQLSCHERVFIRKASSQFLKNAWGWKLGNFSEEFVIFLQWQINDESRLSVDCSRLEHCPLSHVLGIISIPDFYKDVWKNNLHSHYSLCVHVYILVNTCSVLIAYFKFSITETAEFCERSLEVLSVVVLYLVFLNFKLNLERVLDIFKFFAIKTFYHRNSNTVRIFTQISKYLVYGMITTSFSVFGKSEIVN